MYSQMPKLRLPISLSGKCHDPGYLWGVFAFCPASCISAEGKSCNTFLNLMHTVPASQRWTTEQLFVNWMNAPMHEEMLLDFPSLATSLVSVLITSHLGCCSHPSTGCSVLYRLGTSSCYCCHQTGCPCVSLPWHSLLFKHLLMLHRLKQKFKIWSLALKAARFYLPWLHL